MRPRGGHVRDEHGQAGQLGSLPPAPARLPLHNRGELVEIAMGYLAPDPRRRYNPPSWLQELMHVLHKNRRVIAIWGFAVPLLIAMAFLLFFHLFAGAQISLL